MEASGVGAASSAPREDQLRHVSEPIRVREPAEPPPKRAPLSQYWEYADLYGRYLSSI